MTDEIFKLLSAPRKTQRRISAKRWKRDALYQSLMGGAIRYDAVHVQTSPTDQMAEVMAKVDDLDRQILELEDQCADQKLAIREACGGTVLEMYYADALSWKEIARIIHKSESTIYRMRREALNNILTMKVDDV